MQLTPGQRLIYLGQQLDPDAGLYNMIKAWHIHGPLDPDRFARAFWQVAERYDAFRLVFPGRAATQSLADEPAGTLEILDFSAADDPPAALQDWLGTHAGLAFDIEHTTFHSALIRLGEAHSVWYLNQHHLITDITSFRIFYEAVSQVYGNGECSRPVKAFLEFVAQAESTRTEPASEAAMAYWRDRAADSGSSRRVGGAVRSCRSSRSDRTLRPGANSALRLDKGPLKGLAFTPDITRTCIFAAALMIYRARMGGPASQQIGLLVHNRTTRELRDVVGMMVETIPLAMTVDLAVPFSAAVKTLVGELQRSLKHVRYGVSDCVQGGQFDAMLNYLPVRFGPFAGMATETDWVYPESMDAAHVCRLQVHDFNGTGDYRVVMDTNDASVAPEIAEAFAERFREFLAQCLADPERPLGEIDLRLAAERSFQQRFQRVENAPRFELALQPLLQSRAGDELAVVEGQQRVPYQELSERVARFAALLWSRGVRPDDHVAVCLPPSLDAIIAILAVFRLGGVFVPLDPSHPSERIAGILEDLPAGQAGAVTLVSRPDLLVDVSRPLLRPALPTSDTRADSDLTAAAPLRDAVVADRICYVLYTSGSTGVPKGVRVSEGALGNYLAWASAHYRGNRPTDMPLFTSLAFDLTLTSFFLPLVTGGCVHVYHDPGSAGMTELARVLTDDRVDMIKLTPSHLALLEDSQLRSDRLECMVVGGEVFPIATAARVQKLIPGAAIYNEYGPTEATVGCMVHQYSLDDAGDSVPVGMPIDGASVYLLDRAGRPLPAGVDGELCVAGCGLAAGYLNEPELTDEKFVHPFPDRDVRLYRTGDMARWNANGSLDFLGRRDRQVKIHGARVELDEVSATLSQHPEVAAAVVNVVQPASGGRPLLTAYFSGAAKLSSESLRAHLARKLPVFMLPNRFVHMEALPLTVNGKVDLDALPEPVAEKPQLAPRNDQEALMLSAWQTALGAEVSSVLDDFFDLAGDSVAAIQIAAALEAAGWSIIPGDLFQYSTVAAAAAAMTKSQPISEVGGLERFSLLDAGSDDLQRLQSHLKNSSGSDAD